MTRIQLPKIKFFFSASSEEMEVADAINKQKYEINKKQEEVKDLLVRIAAEIESTSCTGEYKV